MDKLQFLVILALIINACLVYSVKSQDLDEDFKKFYTECLEEEKISPTDEDKIWMSEKYDEKAACFIKCLGVKGGLVDPDGKLMSENYRKYAIKQVGANDVEAVGRIDTAIRECKDIDEATPCMTAFMVETCLAQIDGIF